jgi:hypothetical protein
LHVTELFRGELNVLIAPAVPPQEPLGVSEGVNEVVDIKTFQDHFQHLLIFTKGSLSET